MNPIKSIFISLFLISIIGQCIGQLDNYACREHDPKGRAREKTVRLHDLDLKINLLAKEGKVEGKATYKFYHFRNEIDTLFLDAIEMNIKALKLNGNPEKFRADSAGITIYLPKQKKQNNTLEIEYSAVPKRGMYFLNWNNPDPNARKQIWTQGQGIDNRHWVPGFDDVANLLTTKLSITFDRNYPLISNGNLISTKLNPDSTTKTWVYEMTKPHALYLLMIATGDYKVKKLKTKSGIVLEQYYYPEREKDFNATYEYSVPMMDWFEKEIGIPYAWGKVYRNVPTQDFLYGAMENTTSTIFTDVYHPDTRGNLDRPYLAVNAHELAHQWFGDLITERNPTHHWLHESFATHYSKWYLKHQLGENTYDWIRKGERDASFNASRQNDLPVAHSQSGSSRHYPKGSYVLDMLRHELGNENYRRVIKVYLDKYKHGNVESNNLYETIYEELGRNLDWFFDQWIYRGGEPVLQVNQSLETDSIAIQIIQVHKRSATVGAFRLPLDIHLIDSSGQETIILKTILKDTTQFKLPKINKFRFLTIDPSSKLLRKISYDGSLKTEFDILEYSPYAMDRLEALERLRNIEWKDKAEAYGKLVHKETSRIVLVELYSQMKTATESDLAVDAFTHGLESSDHYVRRAAIQSLNFHQPNLKELLIKALEDSSYINIENAYDKLVKLYPDERAQYLEKFKNEKGLNHNLEILYLAEWLDIYKNDSNSADYNKNLKQLRYLASKSSEFRTRTAALDYLAAINKIDTSQINDLIDGCLHFHWLVVNRNSTYLSKLKTSHPDAVREAIDKYPFRFLRDKERVKKMCNL